MDLPSSDRLRSSGVFLLGVTSRSRSTILYDYVYDEVKRATPNQTPGKWADLQGTFVIARSVRGWALLIGQQQPELHY
jgi:hypothetical protein